MAVTPLGRTVTMTAVNEGLAFPPYMGRKLIGLSFQGTGLTTPQRLVVRDTGTVAAGNVIADYQIEAVADNADLWGGRMPQIIAGISIDNNTVAGTWVLTATFEG